MGCRSRNVVPDEVAQDVEQPLGQRRIFAEDQDARPALERVGRFGDERVQPVHVVRQHRRQQTAPETIHFISFHFISFQINQSINQSVRE